MFFCEQIIISINPSSHPGLGLSSSTGLVTRVFQFSTFRIFAQIGSRPKPCAEFDSGIGLCRRGRPSFATFCCCFALGHGFGAFHSILVCLCLLLAFLDDVEEIPLLPLPDDAFVFLDGLLEHRRKNLPCPIQFFVAQCIILSKWFRKMEMVCCECVGVYRDNYFVAQMTKCWFLETNVGS